MFVTQMCPQNFSNIVCENSDWHCMQTLRADEGMLDPSTCEHNYGSPFTVETYCLLKHPWSVSQRDEEIKKSAIPSVCLFV